MSRAGICRVPASTSACWERGRKRVIVEDYKPLSKAEVQREIYRAAVLIYTSGRSSSETFTTSLDAASQLWLQSESHPGTNDAIAAYD